MASPLQRIQSPQSDVPRPNYPNVSLLVARISVIASVILICFAIPAGVNFTPPFSSLAFWSGYTAIALITTASLTYLLHATLCKPKTTKTVTIQEVLVNKDPITPQAIPEPVVEVVKRTVPTLADLGLEDLKIPLLGGILIPHCDVLSLSLPIELWEKILTYLDPASVLAFSFSNRENRNLCMRNAGAARSLKKASFQVHALLQWQQYLLYLNNSLSSEKLELISPLIEKLSPSYNFISKQIEKVLLSLDRMPNKHTVMLKIEATLRGMCNFDPQSVSSSLRELFFQQIIKMKNEKQITKLEARTSKEACIEPCTDLKSAIGYFKQGYPSQAMARLAEHFLWENVQHTLAEAERLLKSTGQLTLQKFLINHCLSKDEVRQKVVVDKEREARNPKNIAAYYLCKGDMDAFKKLIVARPFRRIRDQINWQAKIYLLALRMCPRELFLEFFPRLIEFLKMEIPWNKRLKIFDMIEEKVEKLSLQPELIENLLGLFLSCAKNAGEKDAIFQMASLWTALDEEKTLDYISKIKNVDVKATAITNVYRKLLKNNSVPEIDSFAPQVQDLINNIKTETPSEAEYDWEVFAKMLEVFAWVNPEQACLHLKTLVNAIEASAEETYRNLGITKDYELLQSIYAATTAIVMEHSTTNPEMEEVQRFLKANKELSSLYKACSLVDMADHI